MLQEEQLYDAIRAALRAATVMSLPILITALVVGAVIGLLQALTSIQEMTLTFVPKLAAIVGVFWLTASFMTQILVQFFQGFLLPLIAGS